MQPPYPILVMNGPNLGFLGKRRPEMYGSQSMDDLPGLMTSVMGNHAGDVTLTMFQSNSEGVLIDRLEKAWQDKIAGIVFNAGAYTHTSLALADALAWIDIPCIEVHISNVHARANTLRHTSLIAPSCIGVIAGLGILGYALAVQALAHHIKQTESAAR